ncbi:transporter, major facilitator family protein [Bacteriovorax sp. BAL6_X]|uniref:MFS transporter n=1 Tax=Bacteriovorax sp. BAL6_X TaxID=1201290 RepID=UPI000385DEFA|nr:MFS transporter [Bacteriovorax sp. BAL6_X]EPZ52424.1 transporter, major facilitator family protein [Bacteriovorax sp. BAL6_X]
MFKLPKVLRYQNFRRLYIAGLTSELGSFVSETALMLLVFELSNHNKSYLGAARAVFLFFLTIGNLIGGVIGEKYNRKSVLLFTNYIRIPIIFTIIFAKTPEVVILCDGLIALFTGMYNPTRQAMVNDIVPQKDMNRANALFGSAFAVLHMIGPFLGATMFTAFGGIKEVIALDFLTYIVGIYFIMNLTYNPPKQEVDSESFFSEIKNGIKYARTQKELFAVISNVIIEGLVLGFMFPLILPYLTETLGASKQDYGIALALFGLGGLFGGWASSTILKDKPVGRLIITTLYLEPILMGIWLYTASYTATLMIFAIWGFVVFVRITNQLNYVSLKVETKYLARIFALLDLGFVVPNILGGIILTFVGNQFATEEILIVVCIAFCALIFPRMLFSDMKALFNLNNETVDRDTSIQDKI